MTFVAGRKLRASDLNNELGVTVAHSVLDIGTVNSATYTATRSGAVSPVGVSFVAPTSGKVLVHWACGMFNHVNNAIAFMLCAFRIGEGATVTGGTEVVGPNDGRAIQHSGIQEQQAGRTALVTGLTAGGTYNAAVMYRGATAMTVLRVEIVVQPTT